MIDPLLQDIEKFLVAHKMSPTRFGREALGDPRLLHTLRHEHRELRRSTAEKVRSFMVTYGAG